MVPFLAHLDKYWSCINYSGEADDGSLSSTHSPPLPFMQRHKSSMNRAPHALWISPLDCRMTDTQVFFSFECRPKCKQAIRLQTTWSYNALLFTVRWGMHNRLSRVNITCFKINTIKCDCTLVPLIKLMAGRKLFRNISSHVRSILSFSDWWKKKRVCGVCVVCSCGELVFFDYSWIESLVSSRKLWRPAQWRVCVWWGVIKTKDQRAANIGFLRFLR